MPSTRTLLAALAAVVPLVAGHAAMWGPGVFIKDGGPESAYPLNSQSESWFFRGLKPSSAKGTVELKAGKSVTVKLGCEGGAADRSTSCPENLGSLHIGSDGKKTGCAIAISYKPFEQIKPEDMKVISVLADCVTDKSDHTFALPSNLPAGEATCAWLWIPSPSASASEMYMTGFACEVSSSTPAGSTLVGAKTMLFTAVQGVRDSGNNGQRPLYNDLFANGAQKLTVNTAKKASAKKVPVQAVVKATSKKAKKCVVKRSIDIDLAEARHNPKRRVHRRAHPIR